MPLGEWVRRLGASPPKRICCFMVRIPGGSPEYKIAVRSIAPHGELPLDRSHQVSACLWTVATERLKQKEHGSGIKSLTEKAPYKSYNAFDGVSIGDNVSRNW